MDFVFNKWIFEGSEVNHGIIPDSPNVKFDDYKAFVKETYIRNVTFFSRENMPYTLELISDEFFSAWSQNAVMQDIFGREAKLGGGISFCYIDGNHTYEFVKRDFENTGSYLDVGGFILFDDSADGAPFEVNKLMKEIGRMKQYELVMKNPNYLFKKLS
jgi:hypothetical protein